MIRTLIGCLVLFASGRAYAQEMPSSPSTGSPSDTNGTVSAVTVTQALDRPDDSIAGPNLSFSVGTSIAHGDFGGASTTQILSTAFGARYSIGNLRFTASVPYMRIRTSGVVFTGIDSTPVIVAPSVPGHRALFDGLGDLTLGGSFTATGSGGTEVELSGRIKIPTATKASGLSTRKTDYSAGVQVTKTFGAIAPFISATYRFFGDPSGFNLRNGAAASAGLSTAVGKASVLLFSYHYAQKVSRLTSDAHELFAGASTALAGDKLRLTAFVTAGLSNGAAAASGGLGLSLRL